MKMSICLVASDATRQEAVEQIAFCLEQLVNCSNEMFDCLSDRLKNISGRAVRIEREVEQIASKINQIRTMNSVTEITAPGKFTRMEDRCQYKVLEKVLTASVNAWGTTTKKYKYNSEESKCVATVWSEKQKFYRFTERRRKPRLGVQISDKLQSVADLLLFNTTTNVYMNDRFVNPFDNMKAELHVESQCIVQHATSIADDSTLAVKVKQKTDPLLYQPEFGSLQNFRLPELLFDSASLHNDYSLSVERYRRVDAESQEASTLQKDNNKKEDATEPVLPPMKCIGKLASLTLIGSHFSATGTTEEHETLSERDGASNSADCKNEKSESFPAVDSEKKIIPPAPPPPPPPPPPLPVPQGAVQTVTSSSLNEEVIFGGDRANLMEAIRRAGGAKGAKLRSVRKKEEMLAEDASALPKRNVSPAPPGVDLMSSLTKALEQRRKGIFGKKLENREPMRCSGLSEGAFARMSARIPPPPSKEEKDENDGADKYDDYDWE